MNNKNVRKIRRGDIYLYDYGENEGSIQNGYRPVVVLQADNFNLKAPTIMVAAITTAIRKTFLPSHILVEDKFGLTDPSMIMLEQQRAVNKEELVNYVGHINDDNVLRRIHNGLMKLYGYWDYTRYNKLPSGISVRICSGHSSTIPWVSPWQQVRCSCLWGCS